jgi:hypothetical protein
MNKVLLPVWNQQEPFFTFPERFRNSKPARLRPWRVAPDRKDVSVHVLSSTRDALNAVHPDAIVIGSPAGPDLAKTGKIFFFMALGVTLMFLWSFIETKFAIVLFAVILFSLAAVWFYRASFGWYDDWPIMFNRNTREVLYYPIRLPHFFKIWRPVKPELVRRSWDDVKVRSYKYKETNAGRSFHDSYNLSLMWGGEGGDPRMLRNYVNIGYQGYFEDEWLFQLWEHIRRYMEEDGPAINHGEELRRPGSGKPLRFPRDVIAAAGGAALTTEEVAALSAAQDPAAAKLSEGSARP